MAISVLVGGGRVKRKRNAAGNDEEEDKEGEEEEEEQEEDDDNEEDEGEDGGEEEGHEGEVGQQSGSDPLVEAEQRVTRELRKCSWIRNKLVKESPSAAYNFLALHNAVSHMCPSKNKEGAPLGVSAMMKNADWVSSAGDGSRLSNPRKCVQSNYFCF